MAKKLYFLHIPKTGGLVLRNLRIPLNNNQLSIFSNYGKKFMDFQGYTFINAHFGVTPIDNTLYDTAVLLREPLDRVVSHFTWLMMNNVFDYLEDYNELTLEEKFKKYLFNDDFFISHKNLQTRFLTSKISEENLDIFYRYEKPYPNKYYNAIKDLPQEKHNEYGLFFRIKDWFLESVDFSIESAKSNLDKCLIVGTTENHGKFMDEVFKWFKGNLDLDLKTEFTQIVDEQLEEVGTPYYNFGRYFDSFGDEYTSADFKAMLTEAEIAQIYADNALDVELYNYAKTK